MSYTILTDSSCNLPESIIDRYEIEVLPLRFESDGEEYASYLKGQVTDLSTFYRMMRNGQVFTTSLPALDRAKVIIEGILSAGHDILYIGFSSGLSGTYEAMRQLVLDMTAEHPGRQALCCDTRSASLGEGLLVLHAARRKQAGEAMESLHAWLADARFRLAHWFTVDDLMYLYRGGRVSKTSAFAANILSIKPVLHMDDPGHLVPVGKVRSRRRSIEALWRHMKKTFDHSLAPQTIAISHGDCLEDAHALIDLIKGDEELAIDDIVLNCIDPVIGAHSGPGTLALFYLATTRD